MMSLLNHESFQVGWEYQNVVLTRQVRRSVLTSKVGTGQMITVPIGTSMYLI
jgi:hypothetical protein